MLFIDDRKQRHCHYELIMKENCMRQYLITMSESSSTDPYDVSNASLFSSLDAELEWDRYMIPGYDYHHNRVNNNDKDEDKNPSPSASKLDIERKLFRFNKNTSHLRRRQKAIRVLSKKLGRVK